MVLSKELSDAQNEQFSAQTTSLHFQGHLKKTESNKLNEIRSNQCLDNSFGGHGIGGSHETSEARGNESKQDRLLKIGSL